MPDTEKAEKPVRKQPRPATPDIVPIGLGVGLESLRSIHC
jgi:hypothetical protein